MSRCALLFCLALLAVAAPLSRAQQPVNGVEPTTWCDNCNLHGRGNSNDPYYKYFPNGDHKDFGFFRLGHRWQRGTYDPTWNTVFDVALFGTVELTPIGTFLKTNFPDVGSGAASYVNDFWPKLCPVDSDGDGFTNGVELGDPFCRFPGSPPKTTDLSDPNDALSVPPSAATPTTTDKTTDTTTTEATTTATTTTADATTTVPTTSTTAAAPMAIPTPPPTTNAAADGNVEQTTTTEKATTTTTTAATTTTSVASETTTTTTTTTTAAPVASGTSATAPSTTVAVTGSPVSRDCGWSSFSIVADGHETTFTTNACSARGAGDPHYQKLDGTIVTCDNLGWATMLESSEAKVEVEHAAVGATSATAISAVRVTYKASKRIILFGATPDNNAVSDDAVLVNEKEVTDVLGRNYVSVQRVHTIFGTFLNVQALFVRPTSGILVEGCPAGSNGHSSDPSATVPESEACAGISDSLARYACNTDVHRTGSDEFVVMAKGAEEQRNQITKVEQPKSEEEAAPRVRIVSSSSGPSTLGPSVIAAAILVPLIVVAIVAAATVFACRRRRAALEREAMQNIKTIYQVSEASSDRSQ